MPAESAGMMPPRSARELLQHASRERGPEGEGGGSTALLTML